MKVALRKKSFGNKKDNGLTEIYGTLSQVVCDANAANGELVRLR